MTITNNITQELERIVGTSNLIIDEAVRLNYGHDASWHETHAPDVVVFAENVSQVVEIMKLATRTETYVTPYGSGTGFEGNAIPVKGGITLCLSKMDQIHNIDTRNMIMEAQAGVKLSTISHALKPIGCWLPTFPGTLEPTLGSIISTNASGKWSTLYGCTGDYVLMMDIVLADGNLISVGRPVTKTVSSYDLKRLFIGSEGTLGIVVKAMMRIVPRREGTVMVAHFRDLEQALDAVENLRQEELQLSILEFADEMTTQLMIDLGTPFKSSGNTLIIEIHQYQKEPDKRIETIRNICELHGCHTFNTGFTRTEEIMILKCRDEACSVIGNHYPDRIDHNGELVVPITKFSELVLLARKLAAEQHIPILLFGHAGQGNLHTSVLGLKDSPKEIRLSQEINDHLVGWAVKNNGTATGEHGIGLSKIHHLLDEHPTTIRYMQEIKRLFDPLGILNPRKKIPA